MIFQILKMFYSPNRAFFVSGFPNTVQFAGQMHSTSKLLIYETCHYGKHEFQNKLHVYFDAQLNRLVMNA